MRILRLVRHIPQDSLAILTAAIIALAAAGHAGGASADPVSAASSEASEWRLCRDTALAHGQAQNMPDALLAAVTLAETGRRAPGGTVQAWPWTINAEGRGYYFVTKEKAVWATRRLLADGVRSIDIGCMQINLRFHPRAFTSLEEAFDPASNIAYGAHFLQRLYLKNGSWDRAIAHYHSYSPDRARRYAKRVNNLWRLERKRLAERGDRLADNAATRALTPTLAPGPALTLAAADRPPRPLVLRQSTAGTDLASFD